MSAKTENKLTEQEVRAIIGARLSNTLSTSFSDLQNDRKLALDFYYGRPMGNEIDGRSQVVSKDMMDTIEWMMPSLMRIFCIRDAVQFDPVGPEDEPLAKQETAYVSHVLWKKNPGFMTIYSWIKDALMQKVGYIKYWWDTDERVTFKSFSGLSADEVTQLVSDLEKEATVEVVGTDETEGSYDIKLRIRTKYGCLKVECVPPDEIIVDRKCRADVKRATFAAHLRQNVTRSELIEQGLDRERVERMNSFTWDKNTAEQTARDTVSETTGTDSAVNSDPATQELQLLECWTYLDEDGDGIAELRHYLLAGNDTIENDETDEITLESWTPIPVPHRHIGLGIYDIMEDLQRIKTALQRGFLDNVYFTNNPRLLYNRQTVDINTLLVNRPGGHVAVDGPVDGAALPIMYSPIAERILPVISYFDDVKETRTGVGRMSSGVDADVLAQSTKGAYMDAKSAANQRIEAIARIFAETGYSSLYSSIHRMLIRHQDKPDRFRLRNQWVTVSPNEWQERADLTVSVGLGNAGKEEIRSNLGLMATAQEKAGAVAGLIQPGNVYALFRRMQSELGFENEDFITDPTSPQFKEFQKNSTQSAPDPYVTAEKIKAESRMQEKNIDANLKNKELDQERDLTITELELKAGVDLARAGIGANVAESRAGYPPIPGGPGVTQ